MSPTVHGRRQEFVGGHSRILREFCRGSTFPTTSQQNPNPITTKPQSNPNKTPIQSQQNPNKIATQLQLNPTFRARGKGNCFSINRAFRALLEQKLRTFRPFASDPTASFCRICDQVFAVSDPQTRESKQHELKQYRCGSPEEATTLQYNELIASSPANRGESVR